MNSAYDLYILNEKNVLITSNYIERLMAKYNVNYKVKNLSFFQNAMVHISYMKRDASYWESQKTKVTNTDLQPISDPSLAIPLMKESNERLEFLGDSVIKLIIASYLYNRYDSEGEGFMTKLRTKIESGESLSEFTKIIGLNKYILISRYVEKNNGRISNVSVLEDAFEAFMGALKLDSNYDTCERFIINLIESSIDFSNMLKKESNHKDVLLRYAHQRRWGDPKYNVSDISGLENNKVFTVFVKITTRGNNSEIFATGVGLSKKKAEQNAAMNTLIKLNIIKNTDVEDSDDSMEEL